MIGEIRIMNIFLTYAFMFSVGSTLGWGLEVVFRRFFSRKNPERKWVNPGFLNGPYLPLYGFGLCALYTMTMLENIIFIDNELISQLVLFVMMAAAMTLIEYIAGIIFIKGMKTQLWDYSDEHGNIQGIICPKFSFFWAVLSAVYYFLIHPYVLGGIQWLSDNLAFSFVIGLFFGVFLVDVTYSLDLLVKIRRFAADNDIVVLYERLKNEVRSKADKYRKRDKIHYFLLTFHAGKSINEVLQEHLQNNKDDKRPKYK